MMTTTLRRYWWVLIGAGLLTVGCDQLSKGSPLAVTADADASPAKLATRPVKNAKTQSTFSSLGHSTTVNTSGERACFWYTAWDASKDEVNQTFIQGSSISCVDPGETAEGWLSFDEAPYCKMQGDWLKFPLTTTSAPPGPTLGALNNFFWDAKGGEFYRGGGCTPVVPPPPPPPVVPPPPPPPSARCMAQGQYTFLPDRSTIAQFPATYGGPHFLPEELPLRPLTIPINRGIAVILSVVTQDNHAKPDEVGLPPQTSEQVRLRLSTDGATYTELAPTTDVPDIGGNPDRVTTTYGPLIFPDYITYFGVGHGGPVPVLGEVPTNSVSVVSVSWTCAR